MDYLPGTSRLTRSPAREIEESRRRRRDAAECVVEGRGEPGVGHRGSVPSGVSLAAEEIELLGEMSSAVSHNRLHLLSCRPVGEVDDARFERSRVDQLQRRLVSPLLEEMLPPPQDDGMDHEPELVE